jgi:hypothetical protein
MGIRVSQEPVSGHYQAIRGRPGLRQRVGCRNRPIRLEPIPNTPQAQQTKVRTSGVATLAADRQDLEIAMLPIMREEGLYIAAVVVDTTSLLMAKPGQVIFAREREVHAIPSREWYEPIGDEL